jgi:AcrR family transcriptional regulator
MRSRRQQLLEATAGLAERSGVLSITLEAVADRAGVSKGGLLHHFPNKSALVTGMVEWIVDRYYGLVAKHVGDGPEGKDRIAAAYVATSADAGAGTRLWTAVLTASLLQPSLLDLLRQRAQPLWNAAITGPDDVDAAVAWLAADGLWLAEMLELYDMDESTRQAVVARLSELTAPTASMAPGT